MPVDQLGVVMGLLLAQRDLIFEVGDRLLDKGLPSFGIFFESLGEGLKLNRGVEGDGGFSVAVIKMDRLHRHRVILSVESFVKALELGMLVVEKRENGLPGG